MRGKFGFFLDQDQPQPWSILKKTEGRGQSYDATAHHRDVVLHHQFFFPEPR
jgi:hypothetical protein